jgi:hypothetical protein
LLRNPCYIRRSGLCASGACSGEHGDY